MIIRILCTICNKDVKGSLNRVDMISCDCGNIFIENPDVLRIKEWDKIKFRYNKKWRKLDEL